MSTPNPTPRAPRASSLSDLVARARAPLALALVALACGGPGGAEHEYTAAEGRSRTGGGDATAESIDVPMGRLPAGVTPTSNSIRL
ncbi:MAG: hypothetical protein AB7P00_14860, partial [Sandaracinaceae bacterium]